MKHENVRISGRDLHERIASQPGVTLSIPQGLEYHQLTDRERGTMAMCMLRYHTGDTTYDLEFPIDEIGHAIALCGWTVASRILPRSPAVLTGIRRLESLDALDIPDGRRWFKRYGQKVDNFVLGGLGYRG